MFLLAMVDLLAHEFVDFPAQAEFVNTAPAEEIARVFKEYGEERFSGRMARAVAPEAERHRQMPS